MGGQELSEAIKTQPVLRIPTIEKDSVESKLVLLLTIMFQLRNI